MRTPQPVRCAHPQPSCMVTLPRWPNNHAHPSPRETCLTLVTRAVHGAPISAALRTTRQRASTAHAEGGSSHRVRSDSLARGGAGESVRGRATAVRYAVPFDPQIDYGRSCRATISPVCAGYPAPVSNTRHRRGEYPRRRERFCPCESNAPIVTDPSTSADATREPPIGAARAGSRSSFRWTSLRPDSRTS